MGWNIADSTKRMDGILSADLNFDIVRRDITVGGRRCAFYFIDGLTKDDTVQHVIDTLIQRQEKAAADMNALLTLCAACISYVEVRCVMTYDEAVTSLLSGVSVMLCDGVGGFICMDCRKYPCRSMQEPENDKVLRGSRVGFVETLTTNTALIRRYIRSPSLIMEPHKAGELSKTDVIIC